MSTTSTGLPISSLVNTGSTSSASSTSSNAQLGENQFLQLLTTQLQNQDPLSPMDDTQSVAELAQFSALQATSNLATSFQSFQSNFSVMQSASLIGKTVSAQSTDANGNTTTVSGTINTISVVNGSPEFTLMGSNGSLVTGSNGQTLLLPTSSILSIGT
jgi:flagellar basal-body rod modification protein FlgD